MVSCWANNTLLQINIVNVARITIVNKTRVDFLEVLQIWNDKLGLCLNEVFLKKKKMPNQKSFKIFVGTLQHIDLNCYCVPYTHWVRLPYTFQLLEMGSKIQKKTANTNENESRLDCVYQMYLLSTTGKYLLSYNLWQSVPCFVFLFFSIGTLFKTAFPGWWVISVNNCSVCDLNDGHILLLHIHVVYKSSKIKKNVNDQN